MVQDLLNACVLGSIYLLFALGMSLTWGTIGILNFAHGAVFMFCAFAASRLSEHVGLPLVLYVVVAAIVGALISGAVQLLVFAPIQRRAPDQATAESQTLIGGIGVASVVVGVAAYVTKSASFGFEPGQWNPVFKVAGLRFTGIGTIILVLAIAISVGTALWLKRSRYGLALRTIGVDSETARLMGINEPRLALATMAISGLMAGLAGAMLTLYLVTIDPTTGNDFLLKAFAAIVVGGVGSVLGAVTGSFLLAVIETFVIVAGHGNWSNAVAFALIFVVLLVRPRGLFGSKEVRRA